MCFVSPFICENTTALLKLFFFFVCARERRENFGSLLLRNENFTERERPKERVLKERKRETQRKKKPPSRGRDF